MEKKDKERVSMRKKDDMQVTRIQHIKIMTEFIGPFIVEKMILL